MSYDLTIDPEFESLIPALKPEEIAGLEASVIQEGCRDELVVWNRQGELVLIDGHNRYGICRRNNLPFEVIVKEFESRDEVLVWIEENQLNRRNLHWDWQTYFLGRKYLRQKQAHGGDRRSEESSVQFAHLKTAEELAEQHGVNEATVRRAAKFSEAVKQLLEATGVQYREKILGGNLRLSHKDVLALAEMEPERARKLISRIEARLANKETTTLKGEILVELQEERDEQRRANTEKKPRIFHANSLEWLHSQLDCDLLITDPPYSTDVPDIELFAAEWLPVALGKVKPTGRAYVCIGAYPQEINAYLEAAYSAPLQVEQILVWTYQNTLGPSPRDDYKLNWQAILYFRGPDAPPLDCPKMTEQFSVQAINAPDGRMGDRYHAWQKPDELAERLIRHSTKPNDLVLDCFAGTGTFLLAAARLGRIAFGCDQSREMLAIAQQRGCEYAK